MQTKTNQIEVSEDQFRGSIDQEEILSHFTCLLCYGIALDPMKCTKCETAYCKTCLPKHAYDKDAPLKGKRYTCYKMCGCKDLTQLSKIEKRILANLTFAC